MSGVPLFYWYRIIGESLVFTWPVMTLKMVSWPTQLTVYSGVSTQYNITYCNTMDPVKTKWRLTKQYLALRIRPYLTLIFSFVSRDKYRWYRWPRAGTSCIHLCTLVQEVPRAVPWCSGWSCLIGKARVYVSKKQNVSFPLTQYRGKAPTSNFESCVWRAVSSHSSHHPQEVLLTQFSLYVHTSGLKPFHFIYFARGSTQIISILIRDRDVPNYRWYWHRMWLPQQR